LFHLAFNTLATVPPEAFARDADRLAQFQREA
jgi:hypothetical protein